MIISKKGTNIHEEDAMSHIKGYAVALDITARDIQKQASKDGKPWTIAKVFQNHCKK